MHPAHPMAEDDVTFGAGFSGTVPITPEIDATNTEERVVEEGAFAPGLAPWVGGRVGLDGQFDAGLTYTGRSIRVDGRYATLLGDGPGAVSIGLGASGLLPKRKDDLGLRVGGFGGDVPILLGYMSDADIYSAWIGARGGAEFLNGERELDPDPLDPDLPPAQDISGWHAQAGGLIGLRIGFRYVFAVLELDAAMHWASVDVGDTTITINQFSIAPAGALVIKF